MTVLFHGYGPESIRHAVFQEELVIYVMREARRLATTYDGVNSTNLAILFYFFRAAYHNDSHDDAINFSTQVDQAMVEALDEFIGNDHFFDATNEHGLVLWEVFICLNSLGHGYRVRYLPTVRDWLVAFDERHLPHHNLISATNSLFYWLYVGHWDDEFLDVALADVELMNILRDMALSEYLLEHDRAAVLTENAAGELARFLQYSDAPVAATVAEGLRLILTRYDPQGKGRYLWMRVASHVYHLDRCADFDICGRSDVLEDSVLSIEYLCGESIHFRVQDMTTAQLEDACASLLDIDMIFHRELATNRVPVVGDLNSNLEVVVFADWDEYDLYSGLFFGNSTDNGGIYLEGDPSDPSNTARFIAHLAGWLPARPVWNLEHEYVHYLDGRYNMAGSFYDYKIDTHKTLWWVEGLAEYVAKWNARGEVVAYSRRGVPRLRDVFGFTYASGADAVYRDTYLAMWFMMSQQVEAVGQILSFLRAGEYDDYLDYINEEIGGRYEAEWGQWIKDLNGPPVAVDELAPLTVAVEKGSVSVEVSGAFSDPDGDVLTYGATSTAPGVAAVAVAGSTVTVTPLSAGMATVAVTAVDADGSNGTARQVFTVTVTENGPPVAVDELAPLTVAVEKGSVSVELSGAFSDPDGDVLTYGATSTAPGVAAVAVAGSTVTVTPLSAGMATVAVTAVDADGSNGTARQVFTVTVPQPFTDHPIVAGVTPVKAVHYRELWTRIEALWVRQGWDPMGRWADPELVPGVTVIRAWHLVDLRWAVGLVHEALGRPVPSWTDAVLVEGTTPIRAVHLMELRAAVLAVE